jgi:hypothetical protein
MQWMAAQGDYRQRFPGVLVIHRIVLSYCHSYSRPPHSPTSSPRVMVCRSSHALVSRSYYGHSVRTHSPSALCQYAAAHLPTIPLYLTLMYPASPRKYSLQAFTSRNYLRRELVVFTARRRANPFDSHPYVSQRLPPCIPAPPTSHTLSSFSPVPRDPPILL